MTCAFAALLILEGLLGDWVVRNQAPAPLSVFASAVSGCMPVLLGMVFVRMVFKTRLVRALYDVLAILIWIFMVRAIGEVFTRGAQVLTGEGVYLTPLVSFGLTIGAVLVTSIVGLIWWLLSVFRKRRTPGTGLDQERPQDSARA